jgi:type IV pilus assembly protein PilO
MATARTVNIDFEALFARVAAQFRDLNTSEPGQWPLLPKIAAWSAVAAAAVVVGWFAILSPAMDDLTVEETKELQLKEQYKNKLAQAINLDELRKQKLQVQEYVTQLERQLPGKAEMDALLSDINQAGLGRGLQFELFRPGQVIVRDYYAELPIALRVTGRYHDMGAFTSDVANLSRIVTLHNLSIGGVPTQGGANAVPSGTLTMEATARTYRYLDQAEIEERRNAAAKAAKKPAGGG